ncbi:hypothetical protein CYMTET_2904 [Cymbomonas tetramitiformis]|uniref:Reverse transcriptase domain-containing protein n=1 Tax=Cymbomonas tetramitiformis TaxID=36881 RepID=A0AAE0H4F2_9CHLO|nr:hypothetical protein CYMTET_2904 [Cymbomonas tetramitiformis]
MVPKPGNSKELRLVIDYRQLNKQTVKDKYPLPDIQIMFDEMRGSKYFSSFDAVDGFWQVPMAPKDIEKIAFTTQMGSYEWMVMPQGLKNSRSQYQRRMQRALGHLPFVRIFIDDIVCFSSTIEEHYENVKTLLLTCREKQQWAFEELKKALGPLPVVERFFSDAQMELAEADRGAPVAYRLKLPPHWRIHDVFGQHRLKPYVSGQGTFAARDSPAAMPEEVVFDGQREAHSAEKVVPAEKQQRRWKWSEAASVMEKEGGSEAGERRWWRVGKAGLEGAGVGVEGRAKPGKLLEERLQSSLVDPYGAKKLSKMLRKISHQCKFFGPCDSPYKWFVVLVRVGRVTVSSVVFCWVGTLSGLLREGPRAKAVGDDKLPFTQDFLPDLGVNSGAIQSSVSNLLLRKDIDVPPCNLFLRPTPVMSRKVLARGAINGNNTDI